MIEEVIPCEYSKCDIHIVRPGKSQCSYEGTGQCGAEDDYFTEVHLLRRAGDALAATGGQHGFDDALDNWKDIRTMIDKTKVAKMDMEAFRQFKELEDDIKLYQKMTADWKETAEALAISLGDVEIAQDVYEDISSGLYEVVRERMIPNTNPQKSFDGIHDYAILICTKSGKAEELRIAAEDAGTSDYYYWDGYIAALDYAMDILPNYNS
jgi:hypothetical protein